MRTLSIAWLQIRGQALAAALLALVAGTAVVRLVHELSIGHRGRAALVVLATSLVLGLLVWHFRRTVSQFGESARRLGDRERERATRDRFLAEVVRAQDLEARRIAELLHDDVVQRLTALGLRLELAAMRSGEPALRELAAEAGAVTSAIRRLLVDLHPVILESQGVAAAVDGAAESLRATGLQVEVTPFELRLVPEHEHLAYRLVQEAFANAVAHAEASRIEVSFSADDTTFRCRVEDDGRGVEDSVVEHAVANGSMGLHLVRERIDLAGGSFEIGAREGGGTSFSFTLPLRVREDGS